MRKLHMFLVILLLFAFTISGCSTDSSTSLTAASTANQAPSSSASLAPENKIMLTMFMNNSGLPYPQNIDPSNNDFIKIVEEFANVDLKIEVPPYSDYDTKLKLLLSSNNLPDIVHSTLIDATDKAAEANAFIDLKAYYDKSTTVQRWITAAGMELTKATSGHYWRIPMSWTNAPSGFGNLVRYDLVKKYNNGKWPGSVDEWIGFLKIIKKEFPDSVPVSPQSSSDQAIFGVANSFWGWYGVKAYDGYRVQGGSFVADFTLPEYREAALLHQQLYNDGILDKEFATTNVTRWLSLYENNQITLSSDNADQLTGWINYTISRPAMAGAALAFAPGLTTYPKVLSDIKYAKKSRQNLPVNKGHGTYISSSCKTPDRAWKVIEGFCQDPLKEAIFWGKEGKEFVVKEGKRIIVPLLYNDVTRAWAINLGFIIGFNAGQDGRDAQLENSLGLETAKVALDSRAALAAEGNVNGIDIMLVMGNLIPDDIKTMKAEANQFVVSTTTKLIMGKITISEFDAKVAEYKNKYSKITDKYTQILNENKEKWRGYGVKEVDW